MTVQAIIKDVDFLINAYETLIKEGAENYRVVGKEIDYNIDNIEEIAKESPVTAYNRLCASLKKAKNALEKQMPKKPKTLNYGLLIEYGWKYECPNCGCAVGDNKNLDFAYGEYLNPYDDYCCGCGQALDWSDYNT